MTYDYEGNPIIIRPISIDQLPSDMAIVGFRDVNQIVQKEAYEVLGIETLRKQEIKVQFYYFNHFQDNTLLEAYEEKPRFKKGEDKELKKVPIEIEEGIKLQIGVNLIKENGTKIMGPLS